MTAPVNPEQPGPLVASDQELPIEDAVQGAAEATPPVRETRVFRGPDDPSRRADGRPDWWFEEARDTGDGAEICAETIDGTIRDVRRAAIDRVNADARTLARRRGWNAYTIEYDRIWIWPTPTTGRTEDSYAGYVMARVTPSSE